MKIRSAVFFPACLLGLGFAFAAGYVARGDKGGEGTESPVAGHPEKIPRGRPGGALTKGQPFTPGNATDWVRNIDETTGLSGQRVKIYAALQCAQLSQEAAEELLGRCDNYQGLSGACFPSEWFPSRDLLDELKLDVLTRLSDINPDRAFELFANSNYLRQDPECAAVVLTPLFEKDPGRVVDFLTTFQGSREEVLKQLASSPVLKEHPDGFLQFIPACKDEPKALGLVLKITAAGDRDLAYRTIADHLLKSEEGGDWAFSEGVKEMDSYELESLAEWEGGYSRPEAVKVRAFALEQMLAETEAYSSDTASRAMPIFDKLAADLDPDDPENLARQLGRKISSSYLSSAETWLDGMTDGAVKEEVVQGICRAQLDHLEQNPNIHMGGDEQPPGYWIAKVASPADRDSLLVEYVRALDRGSSEGADPWVDTISNPALKRATKQMLLESREMNRLNAGE